MLHRVSPAVLLAMLALGAAVPEVRPRFDLTPDAVTRATTRSTWSGQAAELTDGRTPEHDHQAGAVTWDSYGLVIVSWPDTVRVTAIRVYARGLGRYRVFGYRGGGFTDDGHRVGTETAVYAAHGAATAEDTRWHEIPFSPQEPIDNLSFQVVEGAAIYELRVLGIGDEASRRLGPWGCGAHRRAGVGGHLLRHLSAGRCDDDDPDAVVPRLVDFVTAGLRAPAPPARSEP